MSMTEDHINQARGQDSSDFPVSKTEQIQKLVNALADNYQEIIQGKPGQLWKDDLPGRDIPGRNLERYESWLAEAHDTFREASQQKVSLTYVSEWVLDNYYIIRQAIHQIEEDLPPGYYKQLPKLTSGPLKDFPRIYAIARAVLSYQHLLLDPIDLQTILIQYQERVPLRMGELWALPIFLRYGLIEALANALVLVINPPAPPNLPENIPYLPEAGDPLATRETAAGENANNNSVANIILSLRTISEQNWSDFFESVSYLEQILRADPAGIYPLMDFKTRDLYRKEIELLSFASDRDQNEVSEIILQLARSAVLQEGAVPGAAVSMMDTPSGPDDRAGILDDPVPTYPDAHVGEYLFGKGRDVLEQQIGYRPDAKLAIRRWGLRHAKALYLSTILLLFMLILAAVPFAIHQQEIFRATSLSFGYFFRDLAQYTGGAPALWIAVFILASAMLIPALTIATSLVNWLITMKIPPRILPKLDFKDEIPESFQTLVVIPAMITGCKEIDSLVEQLELHYLRNPEPGLLFALLTDFRDAESETLPEDEELIEYTSASIKALNLKHKSSFSGKNTRDPSGDGHVNGMGQDDADLFYFLHRKRLWNPNEGKWMGWERKRGKLHELNLLLRGGTNLSFISPTGDTRTGMGALQRVRFVITLDTDTILPRGAANRLAGTLAHPLNRAVFDDTTGQVVSGYTVLQPRMEIHPKSTNYSWFTRFFAGDTGLDLYTLAVSDTYQDLFGEGSYVGKGIYDVDAFQRCVNKQIPENTVLSHDLLEGLMGRAGLVTDITMIEEYPQNYFVQVMRQRRWIRGDWQLLPWLFRPNRDGLVFSVIDRWKMFDNLRRAMLAPALVLIFISGLIFLPDFAGILTAVVLLALGIPVLTGAVRSALQIVGGEHARTAFRPLGWNLLRWLLAVAFLPYEAYISIDAIFTTLYRLLISHHNLLQWTTAAQTARVFGLQNRPSDAWQKMGASTLLALILTAWLQFYSGLAGSAVARTLAYASPVLLLWMLSPLIVWWINHPITKHTVPLDEQQVNLLRQVTRRTWGFFERFVGPEDHWLPPDHFQEFPAGIIAHRTSPTNIGLLFTSTLAAYDLGYLDQFGLATRLDTTIETLNLLERFRGHFLNWYDTLTLQPLHPRYISTVDSGNLAASLLVTAQACKTMPDEPVFRWDLWQGYLDTLSNLTETLTGMRKAEFDQQVEEINRQIAAIHAEILAVQSQPDQWYPLYLKASGSFWHDLSRGLMELVEVGRSAFDLESLEKLQEVAAQVDHHHTAVKRTISELVPWIPLFENIPEQFNDLKFVEAMASLRANLPYNLSLGEFHAHVETAKPHITTLLNLLSEEDILAAAVAQTAPEQGNAQKQTARGWLEEMVGALTHADTNSSLLITRFTKIMTQAEKFVNEMDFRFLYHLQRHVFHIGFNLDVGILDQNYYDLLASEARIASIVAIAKGEVPQTHWLHLGRPVTGIEGSHVLLSWSGTMFEYLMPPLFLRSYPGTLLEDSAQGAVLHQIAYGKEKGVPWGISESGFYRFDANQNYQYRAFGVPGLGFKRGLSDDLVIAPYASLIAIGYDPPAVVRNLEHLIKFKMMGLYGVYEAIDFSTDRLPLDETHAIVGEYMSHHQGMILMAMVNFFHKNIMGRRLHSDPRIQSVDLLLQEQVPQSVPLQDPYVEDVKGIQRLTAGKEEIIPWSVPVQTPIPQTHLLSNGSYNVLLSNAGGGYSTWRDIDLTRWQADGVLDPWGTWIYIQESGENAQTRKKLWSASHQPIPGNAADMQVTYFAHMAVFRRIENGVTSTMEVTVAPDDPVEIRRVHLQNNSHHSRTLRLTSYGEVILAPQTADTRHPAFNKLFIESEFVPDLNMQIFTRRHRSDQESPILMAHMLVVKDSQAVSRHEADRYRFIGRNRTLRSPAALSSEQYLTGTTGATLDPIFSLGQEISLSPHETTDLAYLTFAAESREAIIALARRYRSWNLMEHSFHQADIAAQAWLGKQEITTQAFKNTLQILSGLVYSFKAVRASSQTFAANRLGQPGLWRFGISGDYPILLVMLDSSKQIDLVREALQVHKLLRSRRFKMDVVILNRQQTDYGAELYGMIYRLVSRMNGEEWLNQRGGIYILNGDQMGPEERTLLLTAARVLLIGAKGSLGDQMPGYSIPVHHLPEFTPIRLAEVKAKAAFIPQSLPLDKKDNLKFFNGYGGFSADGREYIIELPPGKTTPAPWVNVIGYPEFGFMVSEAGSQCTWALNSGENRLTPWSNDPVRDPTGEALYLRDEETGEVWTPTPLPSGAGQPYRVTHGAGYTIFEHNSHGLRQWLTLIASPEDPVKIIHLKIENTLNRTRRITATQYVEWFLGTTHAASMDYIIPEYHEALECLLATNPYNAEFGKRVAFLIASKAVHGLTADRTEFLGRGGTPAFPAALHRLGLETRITPGEDPCAVLQLHIDLLPGGNDEIYFVLGQGKDKKHALALAQKYHNPAYVGAAYEKTRVFWDHLLDTVQVHTPEPATDLILNRWMLYQTLSCRIWGRTGFYQSSGAFGFRDQLQDVLALLPIDPAISRAQILNAAKHQFEEGDVMHWWHPPSSRGVRTRISDDLLWLPYVTALYIETTGDNSLLDEKIPFRSAPPLAAGEGERYSEYPQTEQPGSLMEHCLRAIEKGSTIGPHGLPLIGTGDWNDGLNQVGENGQGESIWLAWFLCDVLKRFAAICEQHGDTETGQRYLSRAKRYAAAVEQSAWDGAWYRRAYYDDGTPLGSSQSMEGQIDAIAQSWAVLSGEGDLQRSRQAMQSVLERLVLPQDRLVLLFTPPFDKTPHAPGYIKGYLPGTRENGGQYTHAATWTAWAFACLGDGKQAGALFNLLNPVFQSDTEDKVSVYRVEPYVVSADIYSKAPYIRRGGWTWYTGSASWMYRLGLEAILGFRKIGNTLHIAPVIPPAWDGFEIRYQFGESVYHIQVSNPEHVARHVHQILLDGRPLIGEAIALVDDKQEHQAVVTMGNRDGEQE